MNYSNDKRDYQGRGLPSAITIKGYPIKGASLRKRYQYQLFTEHTELKRHGDCTA